MPSKPATQSFDAIAHARNNLPSRADDDGKLCYPQICYRDDVFTSERVHLEICPVCKSSRYLNPNMRFLVNPECYHKMCESCVDRLFSQGPNQCPVIGCLKVLRKQKFRKQT